MTIAELLKAVFDAVWGLWPVRIVQAWEQGVRLTWGRAGATLQPGAHLFWPVVGEIITSDVVTDVNETPTQTVTTADGQTVTFSLALRYRIENLGLTYRNIQDHDDTIVNQVCASACDQAGASDYEELHGLPEDVFDDVHGRLADWGVDLESVAFVNFTRCRTYRILQGE